LRRVFTATRAGGEGERKGSGPIEEGTEVREESDERSSSMLRPATMRGWVSGCACGGGCGSNWGSFSLALRFAFAR
jgi:hypothetical protein